MSNKIHLSTKSKIYKTGDKIGSNGCVFIEELPSVERKEKGHWDRIVKVECPECHRHFVTKLTSITGKKSIKSCGCLTRKKSRERLIEWNKNKSARHLENQISGDWIFIKPSGRISKNGTKYWYCQCKNNPKHTNEILSSNFGRTLACMKCHPNYSHGEKKIAEILDAANIKYIQQYQFEKCINPKTQRKLLFDFYLPDYNCCIEYDGKQHYSYNGKGWNTKENTEKTQYRDSLKDNYCKENNIRLIRIPYWDYEKIDREFLCSMIISEKNYKE